MNLNDFYANQILDFIYKHAPYIIQKAKALGGNPKQTIRAILLKHIEYQTIVALWDKDKIVGVANFNIKDHVADIQDCVVHPNYRFMGVLKQLTVKAMTRWPLLHTLTFSREKEGNKKTHKISIIRLLKLQEKV